MLELRDGKAETVTNPVLHHLESIQLPVKLFELGSDGASVVLGKSAGEGTGASFNYNHCVAHRLALVCSQPVNQISYLKKCQKIVEQLYWFYLSELLLLER